MPQCCTTHRISTPAEDVCRVLILETFAPECSTKLNVTLHAEKTRPMLHLVSAEEIGAGLMAIPRVFSSTKREIAHIKQPQIYRLPMTGYHTRLIRTSDTSS